MGARSALAAWVLAVVLAVQAAAYYAIASRREIIPAVAPLASFPTTLGDWVAREEFPLDKEVAAVLRADDTLNRAYINLRASAGASLFIAFFKTQRYGQSPHSPKNCLPGSGWQPAADRKLPVYVPGYEAPIVVNEYVIARGENQSVVLYWYQTHRRVIASEFAAKFWLVADAIRDRRSDTALVRIVVPVVGGSVAPAEQAAVSFAQAVYPEAVRQLPQ